jgi:putative tryptophan/tyrosine transport system substrate-binding protein
MYRTTPPTPGEPRPWIGILMVGPMAPGGGLNTSAFGQQLASLNYRDGENCTVWLAWVDSWDPRLVEQARELVRGNPDVMVASGSVLALAAREATREIPIVMTCDDGDAVGAGLVESLAHPGGNVTGLSSNFSGVTGHRLRVLKEAVPAIRRVGVVWNSAVPDKHTDWVNIRPVADELEVELESLPANDPGGIASACERALDTQADALLTFADAMMLRFRRRIIAFAAEHRLPAIYESRAFAASGGLMAYGPRMPHLYARTAVYIDKVLKGARPAELPIETPAAYDLTINLNTADALGLGLPSALLAKADEILR